MVLEAYPDDEIEFITSPQTGIQRTQKFAPTIAEITQACDARAAAVEQSKKNDEWARKKRESDELKARYPDATQATRTANLFVPEGFPRYEKMLARHDAEPDRGSYFEQRECSDGVVRNGLWVPLDWWEGGDPARGDGSVSMDGPVQVSQALVDLIGRKSDEAAA